jgi:PAS domain-containing protein
VLDHLPHASEIGATMLSGLAAASALIGLVVSLIAVRTQRLLLREREAARLAAAELSDKLAFREALLATSDERVTVLGDGDPFSMAGAHTWFRVAMTGPDARALATAVDNLTKNATTFRIVARTPEGEAICVRGAAVAKRPALYVKRLGLADDALDFRAALDAVPVPVWMRGSDLKLRWANQAFLAAAGASSLKSAIAANTMLEKSEAELAASSRDGAQDIEAIRFVAIGGKRRALSLKFVSTADSTIAGIAVDMTELSQTQARLQLNADAAADLLDGMPLAVAVFDNDQRLAAYNTAYAAMWSLPEQWLDGNPALGTILERLREDRCLPEQQNFSAWKIEQLDQADACNEAVQDIWHLPDGRSIQMTMRPHLLGGVTFLFEDISEKYRLESSLALLTQVQRATLDTVDDGIAVFGPDARLVLHNRVFALQWLLAESELAGQPTLAKVVALAESRLGPDGLWRIVAAGVASDEPERCNEWGKATRTDGRIVALAMKRLPNGATVVTFTDLTDVERFHSANKEAAHATA